ncbi:MAG: hypothetical protein AAF242_18730 [Bacteroidota bacterium]
MQLNRILQSLLILTLFSFSFSACSSDDIEVQGAFDGLYQASSIISWGTEREYPDVNLKDTLSYFRDTISFQLEIRGDRFEKRSFRLPLPEALLDCEGEFLDLDKQLEFRATECNCWCDCDPNIDCAGDPILGVYNRIRSGDQLELYLRQESRDTLYSPSTVIYNYWIYEKQLSLTKIN